MTNRLSEAELARLEELLNTSGIGLLGWTTYGDKCNAPVIGEFCKFDDACTPVAGRVETEIYNEETGEASVQDSPALCGLTRSAPPNTLPASILEQHGIKTPPKPAA